MPVSYVYSSDVDSALLLQQEYSIYPTAHSINFAGNQFNLAPGTVKWSLNLTSLQSDVLSCTNGAVAIVRYEVGDLGQSARQILEYPNTPTMKTTTYVVLFGSSESNIIRNTAVLQVLDEALADGMLTTVGHSMSINGDVAMLELTLANFNQTFHYDPSLGLGVLLGSAGGGSSSDNTGLIVGIPVAVGVAIIVVVAVSATGAAIIYIRRRQREKKLTHNVRRATKMHDELL